MRLKKGDAPKSGKEPEPSSRALRVACGDSNLFTRSICKRKARLSTSLFFFEREKRFEPSTLTLARLCSTPELRPHSVPVY